MGKPALFTPEWRGTGSERRYVQVAKCGDCPTEHEFRVNTQTRGGMSDDTILRKLHVIHWTHERKGRDLHCPTCSRTGTSLALVRHLDKDPARVKAAMLATEPGGRPISDKAYERGVDVVRAEAVLSSGYPSLGVLLKGIEESGAGAIYDEADLLKNANLSTETPPMPELPSAGRESSREERRTILDKLAELYVSEEVGYAGSWTDEKLAASLSLPAAWVKALRIEFHGDNGGNEDGSAVERERKRAINELKKDLADVRKMGARLLEEVAGLDTKANNIASRIDRLEAGHLDGLKPAVRLAS